LNLGWGRSYRPLWVFVLLIGLVATEPRFALVILAYGYLLSAFLGMALSRLRSRRDGPPPAA
jgi:hypothetical protein